MNILAGGDGNSLRNSDPQESEELKALKAVIKAWESLPGGRHYSPSEIEDWLRGPMKRAINRARRIVLRGRCD